ncbi:PVC-type heme-binding CxxCH protein [Chitinophaga sp. CF418]|uniref:PVC-type heme-binding CxxCH protein n=1 Tax=Chitinophaga sp. CF418 TaxID=1855287 RepID=UPI00122CA545|nr:PVC-type heme-binding CxxCH protein [Chitinophaga sp. CF418]
MRYRFYLLGIGFWLAACNNSGSTKSSKESDSLAIREKYAVSPVLDAKTAITHMEVEKGLEVQLVAAEPLVTVPVAMTFDEKGRMWVVEMTGYMPDTIGTGEDVPNGKIVILDDTDHDGVADKREVFMDSLVLPRAICLVENGILIAEPPKLWFVEINNGKPGKRTLVDDKYTEGGNVEHQPNGLLRAMDNWIYNAKSDKRYRKVGGKWLKEQTHFRGQWGITQDNYGRLFYNNNSENVLGDYFPAGLGAHNLQQKNVSGYDEKIVPDTRVYPIRATTGVNRGYMKNVLDDSLRLRNMTAACGPLVYRGGLMGKAYDNNIFVAEPSGNLIKRNLVKDSGYIVKGQQAYQGHEFLASTDERFRPVSLYDGPDGALYIVDMYRGIIQHKTYLTPYLKKEIRGRSLTNPLNCGRIYRVVPAGKKPVPVLPGNEPGELLALLDHPNGWVRDKAQQMIIDHHYTSLAPALKERLHRKNSLNGQIHALWTLEGLGVLQLTDVMVMLHQSNPYAQAEGLAALPAVLTAANGREVLKELAGMEKNVFLAPYVALLLPAFPPQLQKEVDMLQMQLVESYANDPYVADAVISRMAGKETVLLQQLTAWNPDSTLVLHKHLETVLKDIENRKKASMNESLQKTYPRGTVLFKTVCQTCHGTDGDGIQSLAPPLNQSEIVTGDKQRLAAIVLFGLTGPVNVAGKQYKAPEISGDMPGIGSNDEFSDKDIAEVLSFIRGAWSNHASKVTEKDIQDVRKQYKGRQKSFTVEELK